MPFFLFHFPFGNAALGGTWNDFTTDGKNQSGNDEAYGAGLTYFPYFINGVQQTANGTPTFVQSARNGRYYAQGNVKVWYPATGFRHYNSENNEPVIRNDGSYGYYWSSTVNGSNDYRVYYFIFHSGRIDPVGTVSRIYGYQVRCLRE